MSVSGFEDAHLKRFTETTKWDDPWFWDLSPTAKLLWIFLCDHCDGAGIVEFSPKIAAAKIGQPVKEQHLAELSGRLHTLECGKLLIRQFIRFQYGSLSRECKPHQAVFASLKRHNLEIDPFTWEVKGLSNPTMKGYLTLQEKDQEKEKEKEKDKSKRIKDSTVLPPALDASEPFRDAWERWLSHLKQKRSPATLHAQDLQLAELAEMGIEKAIITLNHCIKKNWRGIYEPTDQSNTRTSHQPPPAVKGSSAVNGF